MRVGVCSAAALTAALLAGLPARAQPAPPSAPVETTQPTPEFRPPPPDAPPGGAEEEPADLPPPPEEAPATPPPGGVPPQAAASDPNQWWSRGESRPAAARDPLFGRRASRQELARAPQITSNADPLLYRLWDLQPLQLQALRQGELIIEVWMRPQASVRQAVIRITLRDDGRGFIQARAGLGCCSPQIGRRIDIDRELPVGYVALFRRLASDPAWSQPENVTVDEGGGTVEGLCVGGIAFDLVLVERTRAVHLRRACGGPEIGSVADILSAAIGASMGKDLRFDVLFPHGADFSSDRKAFQELAAGGGRLKPRRP